MRKMKLLIVLLLAYSGMKAQNTALQFDGVDDYVEVVSQPHRKNLRISTGFTIEFILRVNSYKGKHTLLFQDGRNGVFEIGLDAEMKLYTNFNHENFLSNEPLPVSECIHVSIIYHSSGADIYMNGNPFTTITNAWSGEIFTLSEPFLLGLEQGNPSSAFDGFLENFRIINEVVDNGVIAQYTFKTLPISFPELALYLDGSMKATNKLRDPYYSPTTGYLGGTSHNGANIPSLVEQHCVSEYDVPESVSSSCQPLPACSTAGLPAGELICNGSFEQYCNLLNNPDHTWMMAEHPFQYSTQTAGGVQHSVAGSDVVNWDPYDYNTPDFFVRNGIGSPVGFYPVFGAALNYWFNPPTNTHNGLSNAVAGLHGEQSSQEAIFTTLLQNLLPSTTYQFSGWFYNTTANINNWTPPSGFVGNIANLEIYVQNSTQTQTLLMTNFTVPYHSVVSGNNNWYFSTVTFTTPSVLNNFDKIIIKNSSINLAYVFIDDLSLMEVPATSFPQYIHTGNNTDSFHRTIKVDANDNVYVCGNSSNVNGAINFGTPTITNTLSSSTDEYGSFMAKYSSGGTLLWSKWIPYVFVNDFEIMPNGNLLLVGYTIPVDLTAMLPAPPFNYVTPFTQPAICNNVSRNYFHYETGDVFYGVLDKITGNPIGNYEIVGAMGYEVATNVEIIGNTAYIAVEIYNLDCTPTLVGALGWEPAAIPLNNSQVVSLNLSTMQRSDFPGTPINSWLIELTKHNTDLILLSGDNLTKFNTLNNTTQNFPLPLQGGAPFVNRVHAAANGDLYLLYDGMVEKRHVNNLGVVVDFEQTNKYPIGITSRANDIFIAYSTNGQFQIEKLEGAGAQNLLDADWSLNSSGNNMFINTWQSLGDWKTADLAPLNNSAEIACVFNYQSTSNNWSLSLPPKNLFGTNGISHAHTIVAKVIDNTSGGQYNKDEFSSNNTSSLVIYPNPTEGVFTVQSIDAISFITVANAFGQRVAHYAEINNYEVKIDLSGFAQGVYTLIIDCNGTTEVKKLVLNGN